MDQDGKHGVGEGYETDYSEGREYEYGGLRSCGG